MEEKRTIEGIVSHFAMTAAGQKNQVVVRVSPSLYFNFMTDADSLAEVHADLISGVVVKVEFSSLEPGAWKILEITKPEPEKEAAPEPAKPAEECSPADPVEEEEEEEEEFEYTVSDLNSMKKDELISLCEYYELDTEGIKKDLVKRLCKHHGIK